MHLPNFRNIGVLLRVIASAELLRILSVYSNSGGWGLAYRQFISQSYFFEPILLIVLVILHLFARRLIIMSYIHSVIAVIVIVTLAALTWRQLIVIAFPMENTANITYVLIISVGMTLTILGYFNWRHRVLSPAISESRLLALQARIRPHFLFNSINTVLGMIREDPKRAECILENLADLFHTLLAEAGSLVRLDQEIEHAKAYAEIEAMRLGDRLTINWQCQGAPPDAMVPPLTLQPLLENAVYHGIEPLDGGGVVTVSIFLKNGQIHIVIRNPYISKISSHVNSRSSNHMALNNIRERLSLHFDAEAEMKTFEAGLEFIVQIRFPYERVKPV